MLRSTGATLFTGIHVSAKYAHKESANCSLSSDRNQSLVSILQRQLFVCALAFKSVSLNSCEM